MATDNITKEVLIRLKLDTSDQEKKSAALGVTISDLTAKQKAFKKEMENQKLGDAERLKAAESYKQIGRELKDAKEKQAALDKELLNNKRIVTENVGSNQQLKALLSSLTAEYNKMGETTKTQTERGKFLTKTIREISDTLKANESAVGDNYRNVGNYPKEELAGFIAALKKSNVELEQQKEVIQKSKPTQSGFLKVTKDGTVQIKAMTNALDANTGELISNEEAYSSVTSEIELNNAAIEEAERTLIGFNKVNSDGQVQTTKYANNLAGLKQKVADLSKTLQTQTIGTKEFEATNKAISDTSLKILEVQGKVDEFGNKEPKNLKKKSFDDLGDAVAGVTAAVQLSELAFGKSNNTAEAQARILKFVAIQQAAVNLAKGAGAVADQGSAIAAKIFNKETGLMAKAQGLLTQALGKSTGAARLFKGALIGTGIGAIILLLTELIFNFETVSNYVKRAVNAYRDWVASISDGNKVIKFLSELLLLVASPLVTIIRLIADFEGTVKSFQNSLLDVAHKLSDITADIPILGAVIKALVTQVENTINSFNRLATSIGLMGKPKFKVDIEALTKFYDEFRAAVDQSQVSIKNQIELLNAQGNKSREVAKLQRQLLLENIKAEQQAFNVAEEMRKKTGLQENQLRGEQYKLYIEKKNARDKAINDLKVFEAEQVRLANERKIRILKQELDLENELIAMRNEFIDMEYERNVAAENLDYKLKVQGLNDRRKALSLDHELTKKEIDQFDNLMWLTEYQHQENLIELEVEENIRKDEIRKEQQAKRIEAEKNTFTYRINQLRLSNEQELLELETFNVSTALNNDEKLEEEKSFQLKKLEIQRKGIEDQLKESLRFLNEQQQLSKQGGFIGIISDANILATKDKIEQLKKLFAELGIEIKKVQQTSIVSPQFSAKFQQGVQEALGVLDAFNDAVNASFAAQQAAIDKTTKANIKGIEDTTLTKLQKEELIKKEELKSQKEKYDLQIQQFNFNKGIQIVTAIANTAQAVIAALTNPVPFAGAILAGIAAATGAVQIGIIAAQQPPPPPFYEGGYTGEGNPKGVSNRLGKKSYTYHNDEYVVPSKVLRTNRGSKLVQQLDLMRTNKIGSLGLEGFADGGYTSSQLKSNITNANDLKIIASQIVDGVASIQNVVLVSDINRVNGQLNKAKVKTSL